MAFVAVIAVAPNTPVVAERLVAGGAVPDPPDPPGPPPSITWLDPAPGAQISRSQPITVRVTDSDLILCILSVRFDLSGIEELVFRRGAFSAPYAASTAVQDGDDLVFTLRRVRGWPLIRSAVAGLHERAIISVDAVDAEGQLGT